MQLHQVKLLWMWICYAGIICIVKSYVSIDTPIHVLHFLPSCVLHFLSFCVPMVSLDDKFAQLHTIAEFVFVLCFPFIFPMWYVFVYVVRFCDTVVFSNIDKNAKQSHVTHVLHFLKINRSLCLPLFQNY